MANVYDEYHAVALSEIHLDHFNRAAQTPAAYLMNTLHILAEALVYSSTNHDIGAGEQPIFPPDKAWLETQIKSIWMTMPKQPVEHFASIPIFTVRAGMIFPISLSLMHYDGNEGWDIGYATKHHRALVWNIAALATGNVVPGEE